MELDTIEEAGESEVSTPSFGWYVALTQLPGIPARLRAACEEGVTEMLQHLPVAGRRSHAWHPARPALPPAGGARAADDAAETGPDELAEPSAVAA
jgi:hypothetical protein